MIRMEIQRIYKDDKHVVTRKPYKYLTIIFKRKGRSEMSEVMVFSAGELIKWIKDNLN